MAVQTRILIAVCAPVLAIVAGGCQLFFVGGPGAEAPLAVEEVDSMAPEPGGDRFPDVLAVELRPQPDGTYDVAVTLSSPYDTPQRYADGWRVLDAQGETLGMHTLLHDHAAEQPFTRTQSGLIIPEGTTEVVIQGRDQANGYGGLTITVAVPEAP